MNDIVQYIIVGIVVAVAFALAARSIFRLIKNKKSALNPCDSCQLREACQKKQQQHDDHCNEYLQNSLSNTK